MHSRGHILDIRADIVESHFPATAQILLNVIFYRNLDCFVPEIMHSQACTYKHPRSYELRGAESPSPNRVACKLGSCRQDRQEQEKQAQTAHDSGYLGTAGTVVTLSPLQVALLHFARLQSGIVGPGIENVDGSKDCRTH